MRTSKPVAPEPNEDADVFDWLGKKIMTRLVETAEIFEGMKEPFRSGAICGLEEFYFRMTGKHFDWEELSVQRPAIPMREPEATPDTRPIASIGLKILHHPKFKQWEKQGYASQESDGLWLHYTAVCELLRETEQ